MQAEDCRSKNDVSRYILGRLQWVQANPNDLTGWVLRASFRRGFHLHALYEFIEDERWAFHVDEWGLWDGINEPLFGSHETLGKLIDHVSDVYWKKWKL